MPGAALDSALQRETVSSGAVPFTPALAVLLAAFSAVYLPSVGHGFLKDDFGWILRSPLNSWQDAAAFWRGAPSGFFRPLVSLSFGVNRWGCGLQPRCYGLSNLVLLLACAAAIFVLVRGLELSKGAALLASALWIFNWHGINMSALWISARTALLLVLFAVLAAGAFVRGRFGLAAVLSLAAMFAKEEGIVIPIVLLATHAVLKRTSTARIQLALFALAAGAGQLLYLVLRARSGAITFSNAPEVYVPRLTFSRLMENLPEYVDRTSTFTAVIVLLAVAMCRPSSNAFRKPDRPIIVFGLFWWIGGLALTMFLPVRSSLYACLPSVGSVLIGTVVISGVWSSVPRSRQRDAVLAGLALPFLLWPVYRERNSRWVREADLSSQTIAVLRDVASERGAGTTVLLEDDRSARPSLDNSFGAALPRAVELLVSPPIVAWIEPPTTTDIQRPSHFDVRFALRSGRLVRVE